MRYGYILMRTEYVLDAGKLGRPICDGIYTTKKLAIDNMMLSAKSLGHDITKYKVDILNRSVVYQNKQLITRYWIIRQAFNIVPWDNDAERVRITEKELAG